MSNAFDNTYAAVRDAEAQLRAADQTAEKMAYVLRGRMRLVDDAETLRQLKHELQQFDARTGRWRKK